MTTPATAPQGQAVVGTHNTLNITIGSIISYPSQLPVASELQAIESLAPGATRDLIDMQKQVVGMAEGEQEHRHQMECEDSKRQTRGQIIGPTLGAVAIIGAVWTGLAGHTDVAITLGGATAVSVVSIVLLGRMPWSHNTHPELESRTGG